MMNHHQEGVYPECLLLHSNSEKDSLVRPQCCAAGSDLAGILGAELCNHVFVELESDSALLLGASMLSEPLEAQSIEPLIGEPLLAHDALVKLGEVDEKLIHRQRIPR